MKYIDPHIHLVSRTTDDYQRIALAGCRAVSEPAFWAGYDRSSPQGFYDYFRHLTDYEPKRAAQYGIQHHCWVCINSKEAEDAVLAREVIQLLPEFLDKPTCLGIGEIGLNKNSKTELEIFEAQAQLAIERKQLILCHTPHLEDKLKGTRLMIGALKNLGADPDRVWIDHVEEHTVQMVLDGGFHGAMTLYPHSKCSPARAADILEVYGGERLGINTACDWGVSDPMAVPLCAQELRMRGHGEAFIEKVVWGNPKGFFGKSGKFRTE